MLIDKENSVNRHNNKVREEINLSSHFNEKISETKKNKVVL